MSDAPRATGWRYLPLAAVVVALDQLSKSWIERHFELYERRPLLPVLEIIRAHNPGAAFSFLADSSGWQRWLFTLLALAVSAAIILWLRRLDARVQPWLAAGLALVMGGALGNVADRMRIGYVIDFINVHWGASYFPAFNVADSAITVGAGMLLLDAWLESRRQGGARP